MKTIKTSTKYIMELPNEITSIITQYAWAWRAPTRPNWREGSSIISLVKSEPLWQEWKEYQEWKEVRQKTRGAKKRFKPRTSINDVLLGVLLGVSVAVCADIFVKVMNPYFSGKLK